MSENSRREPEISRRQAEMYRVEAIQLEMASAVRLLGGDGPAKEANNKAARAARLSVTVVERLRWRKIKRPAADLVDTVREALERHNAENLARARHELLIARQAGTVMAARLREIDPDFYGPEIDRLRGPVPGLGRQPDLSSGG